MPELNWIGKSQVVNHAEEVPFRLLRKEPDSSEGIADSGNMILHGDNLEALKALLPYYRSRVKLVFIDPPYNTGNEGWSYNDKMNAPKLKKWFGKVVGGQVKKTHEAMSSTRELEADEISAVDPVQEKDDAGEILETRDPGLVEQQPRSWWRRSLGG